MGHVFISADTRLRIHDLIKHTEGMTQAKLAKELGISESTLSRFLSGQTTKMGNDRIIKIANIFNVSTDFLLGETNIPVKKNYDISELGLSAEAAQAFPSASHSCSSSTCLVKTFCGFLVRIFNSRYSNGVNTSALPDSEAVISEKLMDSALSS